MEERLKEGFYARFLGGFSLKFAGQEMLFDVNPQGKTMQLIYFLLKSGANGCEKKELLELVRPGEKDRKRRMNNFRQQIFRVRELIHDSYFPQGDYFVYQGNRCYFTLDYPLYVDTERLDALINQMRTKPVARQLCEEYCEAYTGEFLPVLGGEEWVALESAYYQNWYFTCLSQLSVCLKEEGKFEQLLRLSAAASQIHPYDEWQVVQIECLL